MDPRHEYLLHYVQLLADFCDLRGWVFRVSKEAASEDEWAHIHIDDYDEAQVSVGTLFWNGTNLEKTQVLLHELMHCPFARINEGVHDGCESLISYVPRKHRQQAARQLAIHKKAAARAEERMVNQLAVVLARHAPKFAPPSRKR